MSQLILSTSIRFQFLVCQFDVLQHLNSKDAILSALDDLPLGLDETYNRLLLSLDTAFQPQILGSLKWLASARRPLHLEALAEIFIFSPKIAGDFTKKRLFDPKGVLRYFPSLVTTEVERYSTFVRLAHFTVKEYLISDRIQQSRARSFHFTEAKAHLHTAHCCLSYSLCPRKTGRNPHLIVYAIHDWAWHLEQVPRTLWTPEVLSLAESALSRGSAILGKQRRPYCYTAKLGALELTKWLLREDSWTGRFVVHEDLDLALIEAVEGGDVEVVQYLLKKGAHANARHTSRSGALQAATRQGNLAVMKVLLDNGADIDAHDEASGSPLQAAARSLRFAGMRMLVGRGANVRKTECILSCLLRACGNISLDPLEITECIEILQLFLDNGADISKVCTKHESAFFWAIQISKQEKKRSILDFVLQQGAHPNLNSGRDPLQEACRSICSRLNFPGSHVIAVIENLLSMGADVNGPVGENGTALQFICMWCQYYDKSSLDPVRLLLDKGAEINQSGRYGTALYIACQRGYLELVDLLLDRGADCGVEGGELGNALQAACDYQSESRLSEYYSLKIARKLLERGANVNAPGGKFGSALQAAVSNNVRNVDLESLLLSKGAEVNRQGGIHGTALQSACASGKMEAVRLLLDHGADVDTAGGKYGSALQAACGFGDEDIPNNPACEIARLLIEHGADVHAQGGIFGSAWHAAATIGSRRTPSNDTLKLLLDHGVDVNDSRGQQHGTALQAALELFQSSDALVSRVRFLLEHGADINLEAGRFGFPLQSACVSVPFPETCVDGLRYLLDNCPEIDVNMIGGFFGTALQAAAWTGYIAAVELLLENGADANTTAGPYNTALQAAAHNGTLGIVELLLAKGSDINIHGGKYRSAVNAAIFEGYWDIVERLLDAGARPDCHQLPEPDEEWLKCISEEHGKGAVDRYRKFWDIMKLEWSEGTMVKGRNY